ncbi:GNAT family N-acetyltransferase [Haladaptatus sp. CMAA 1911]|uniref:GNAT family N-acetyltransferase n=1 Tax=unclassified Haladaptatus TaxID=2622732 RepID=UPI003754BA15
MTESPEIRSASDWDEVGETAARAGRAFPDETFELFRRRTMDAPSLPLENTLLLLIDGEIASSLQIYQRQCFLGGRLEHVGAIGNVMTLPEHRGEGHASTLLRSAVSFLVERGVSVSFLIGDPGFYSRLGWRRLPSTKRVVADPPTLPSRSGNGSKWIPFDADRHLDELVDLYRRSFGRRDGTFARPSALWSGWILRELVDRDDVLLYEEGGEVRGYLAYSVTEETAVCHETGYLGGEEERFRIDCWNALSERDRERIVLEPPLGTLADSLADADVSLSEETMLDATGEAPMVRLHNGCSLDGGRVDSTDELAGRIARPDWFWSTLDKF